MIKKIFLNQIAAILDRYKPIQIVPLEKTFNRPELILTKNIWSKIWRIRRVDDQLFYGSRQQMFLD